MEIAMMSYTMARGAWGKAPAVAALCDFTRELGLQAVDWVGTYGHAPSAIRRITDDYGLRNICYTFHAPLHHPDAGARRQALDAVKQGLETAAVLGADKVMMVVSGSEGVPREESRRRALPGLAEAVSLGQAAGITVTIEHFPGRWSPFVTSSDMAVALAQVPGLRITYDNGNAVTGGEDAADAYRRSRSYIVHAHFKDWHLDAAGRQGVDGRRYVGALVGEGIVDPEPCLAAMQQGGYDGYINFEYEGDEYTPATAMRRGVPYLRQLLRRYVG